MLGPAASPVLGEGFGFSVPEQDVICFDLETRESPSQPHSANLAWDWLCARRAPSLSGGESGGGAYSVLNELAVWGGRRAWKQIITVQSVRSVREGRLEGRDQPYSPLDPVGKGGDVL